MLLLALLLQLPDSLPPKPAPPPAAWLALIGAYAAGADTFYVYEDHGALAVFMKLAGQPEPVTLRRLAMGPRDGGQPRLQPVRPVAELLQIDRGLVPPAESGAFLVPDLVEPARLDSSVHLDVRYATTNNFLGSVFYSSAHA